MQRKRRKSEDTEDKRACMSPSMLHTPVSGLKELQPTRFKQWGVDEVVSFLSTNGFDKYASIFEGTLNVECKPHHDIIQYGGYEAILLRYAN